MTVDIQLCGFICSTVGLHLNNMHVIFLSFYFNCISLPFCYFLFTVCLSVRLSGSLFFLFLNFCFYGSYNNCRAEVVAMLKNTQRKNAVKAVEEIGYWPTKRLYMMTINA